MQRYLIIPVLIFLFMLTACKKFTEVDPPINQVSAENVFSTDANAISAITGIYSDIMSNPNQFANCSLTFYAGLSAGETGYYSADVRNEFSKNEITRLGQGIVSAEFWTSAYKYIYTTNLSLEKLQGSTGISSAVKSRLMGECYYLRAFCYFTLVNLFGDVPLAVSSDYNANRLLGRSPVADVWQQITSDLVQAAQLLPATYALPEKSVPNKWAAKALLAKTYLYLQQWTSAATTSNEIIQSGAYQLQANLNDVFLKTSSETLWQLAPVLEWRNSWEGYYSNPNSNSSLPTYVATPFLLSNFEPGDNRKTNWLRQRSYNGNIVYYPYKYKVKLNANVTEYQVVMRLAEVILIRAEANLYNGLVSEAVADINTIRTRAGLGAVNANITVDSCKQLLIRERQSELFAEWGNRWFDLKRWNIANEILSPVKGSTWQPTDVLYPIPQTQLELNPNLIQNPGYN